jgi:hypothetical protein
MSQDLESQSAAPAPIQMEPISQPPAVAAGAPVALPEPPKRVFAINDSNSNAQYKFPSNEVKTSRYTIITFLPVNLFEQFRRLANFYFLITVLLDCIEEVQVYPVYTMALPLAFILAVSAVKAGYEDYVTCNAFSLFSHFGVVTS